MRLQVTEIIGRSTQGITQPFICRCNDGEVYFVKGRGAGRRSLVCEWIASNLAYQSGLPVAPFAVVEVPQSLIDLGSRNDLLELGSGPAFGSRRKPVIELSAAHLINIPLAVQRDVLAFDWWVHNGDRTLSESGGNPNLFWDVEGNSLMVIDHNQAFDPAFEVSDFKALHAFCAQREAIAGDSMVSGEYRDRFTNLMANWDHICNTTPPEWWFIDDECTIAVEFDKAAVARQLFTCQNDDFWKGMR